MLVLARVRASTRLTITAQYKWQPPSLDGRLPRLEARVNGTIAAAQAGLERIANRTLKIGMDLGQVRQLRGSPKRVTQTATAGGARLQWDYGMTVLLFEHGQLAEIRQFLR